MDKRLFGNSLGWLPPGLLLGWWEHCSALPAWLGAFSQDREILIFPVQALLNNPCWLKYQAPSFATSMVSGGQSAQNSPFLGASDVEKKALRLCSLLRWAV